MPIDIKKIFQNFGNNKNTKKDETEEDFDENSIDSIEDDDIEDEVFEEAEEIISSTSGGMDATKKKKIAIIAGAVLVGGSALMVAPDLISSLASEEDAYNDDLNNIQQSTMAQNNAIQQTPPPLKRPPVNMNKPVEPEQKVDNKPITEIKNELNNTNTEDLLKHNEEKISKVLDTTKIEKTNDLIENDNTEKILDKINTNSTEIKEIVDQNLNNNLNKSVKELNVAIDPFLLESMVIVDNNYHKKVMLSQVDMMKEFMKYLDIKKQFDTSIQEYKEGKIQAKSIEEKILDELQKFNLNGKLSTINNEIETLKEENEKLKYLIKQKVSDIDVLNAKLSGMTNKADGGTAEENIDENAANNDKLSSMLNSIEVESLNVYTINNIAIAEISVNGKYKIYKTNDIFNGFKIKSINMDGIMLSYIDSKNIERTRFINTAKDLEVNDTFDVLKIPTAGFKGETKQEAGKTTLVNQKPQQPRTINAIPTQNTEKTNTSVADKFMQRLEKIR